MEDQSKYTLFIDTISNDRSLLGIMHEMVEVVDEETQEPYTIIVYELGLFLFSIGISIIHKNN